ncbi:LysM peptidoglycan-binding domain-containing protein, partial [Acidocella sp.]|uniref:LysM peptidoglycan-binding domain-containing protein n=1 Tax=Acidocella sp. TaxID=50710 RepID=UPI0026120C30
VRVDQQGNTVIAGRAAPGATVTILDNGKPLGTVTADGQGAFVFLPASPLAVGSHEITLSAALPNGKPQAGVESAEVSVPANGGQVLTVLSGPNGSQVLSGQGPAAGALALGAVDYDTKGHAIFAGTAPAGTSVSLHLGNTLLGSAKADASGHWHIAAATPAAPGMLVVTGETASGSILPPVTQPFAPEALAQAFANGQVIIVPGDNLWLIARHIYGNGLMYTLIYTANSSQIHDPNLIFPGQTFVLPKPKG